MNIAYINQYQFFNAPCPPRFDEDAAHDTQDGDWGRSRPREGRGRLGGEAPRNRGTDRLLSILARDIETAIMAALETEI